MKGQLTLPLFIEQATLSRNIELYRLVVN